ncbi:MAG: GrpB family protein [bacterium]|nr:GrpB family protein [bacterium]
MLTPEQEKWIETLSSDRTISIVPYDPRTEELFDRVRDKIKGVLGPDINVCHVGASSFGISGQDEIDVQVPVEIEKFPVYIPLLEIIFGEVRKIYPTRVRFEVKEDGKKIDFALVDANNEDWLNHVRFQNYMKNHPLELERYRTLKEELNGMTVKEYYRRKTEYINEILDLAN